MNSLDINLEVPFSVYPYVDNGNLILDIYTIGDKEFSRSVPLTVLFNDFIEYRRNPLEKAVTHPEERNEVVEAVALLRFIARELEKEVVA